MDAFDIDAAAPTAGREGDAMRRDGARHQRGSGRPRRAAKPEGAAPVGGAQFGASPSAAAAVADMDAAISRLLFEHGSEPAAFALERRVDGLARPRYRISGDAMRDAGILDGDAVEVMDIRAPEAGDVVLVSKGDGRFEVRRAFATLGGMRLRGEGSSSEEIDPADSAPWMIHGVAQRVARDF